MFNSQELLNANETPASLTSEAKMNVNIDLIKDELKKYVLIKNTNNIKSYDYGNLSKFNTNSSGESLKNLFKCIRDYYIDCYKNDDTKILLIKKLFDNILNNLDCIVINGIDLRSDEINTLILGYLNKNYL